MLKSLLTLASILCLSASTALAGVHQVDQFKQTADPNLMHPDWMDRSPELSGRVAHSPVFPRVDSLGNVVAQGYATGDIKLLSNGSLQVTRLINGVGVIKTLSGADLTMPPGWRFAGFVAANSSGTIGIIIRNLSTGQTGIWEIDTLLRLSDAYFLPVLPADWEISGVSGVLGDIRIYVRNRVTRDVGSWKVVNRQFVSGAILSTPPPGWDIVSVNNAVANSGPRLILRDFSSEVNNVGVWRIADQSIASACFLPSMESRWVVSDVDAVEPTASQGAYIIWRDMFNSNRTIFWFRVFDCGPFSVFP